MDYKTFFEQNKMLGDSKKYNRFAHVKQNCTTEECMVERDGVMYMEDGNSKKITLVFRFNNGILKTVETVRKDIKSIICSDNYDKAESVSIQTVI